MLPFYLIMAIISGLCMSFQSPANATLSRYTGNLQATCVSFGTGMLCVAALMLAMGDGDLSKITDASWWQLLGGTYGIYIVLVLTYAMPRLGAALTSTILTLGQITTGMILDTFGLLGLEKISLAPERVLGALVVLTGIILVYIGKKKQENGKPKHGNNAMIVILSVLAGVAGAIQAPTNNALSMHVGRLEASFVSFTVGFLCILTITLIKTKGHILKDKQEGAKPWMLSGGPFGAAVVMINLFLISQLGSIVLQITTMFGQLTGGMLIDSFGLMRANKIKANGWRWAGMAMIAAGVTVVVLTKM